MSKIYRREYLKRYFRYLRVKLQQNKTNLDQATNANLDKNKPKRAKAVL